MGRESEGAVVDPATLKIHGIDGIRVCDASIFHLACWVRAGLSRLC